MLLIKDGQLLLQQRNEKDDGLQFMYAPIAGKIEERESPTEAMIREAAEEAGITIKTEDLTLACTLHWADRRGKDVVEFYFTCSAYAGEPRVMEPGSALSIGFYPLDQLPDKLVGSIPRILKAINEGRTYLELRGNLI